ncbi:MAG TPA: molybdopterin-dependent oxidoreductase [Gemmatimonadales bacterium]|nr:molybdopterin-dependent oxidoreductase [Gemmatimonadales bacterium]
MGRGGATTFQMDLANADCILIMGSNFAECHPVGFRFVMRARERGAEIIHVDPRFTRTSACATRYAQIRAGSDIAFLGGLINYVINSERWNTDPFFKEYVTHYTNAPDLIDERLKDPEDLAGLFSGWKPSDGDGYYEPGTWQYAGHRRVLHTDHTAREVAGLATMQALGARSGADEGGPPKTDFSLQHPYCAFQVLKRHFARYTPDVVAQVCGVPRERFLAVAEALLRNSGRERTSAIAYAVGWTQHTTGPQIIATAAILQLLLGNIGRPGGGIQALRGHATIQGSTDIPTLYDLLPGYLRMPTHCSFDGSLDLYVENEGGVGGLWAHTRRYLVSLLKAYFGADATAENDFGYDWLPRITGDHSHLPMFVKMHQGEVEGLFLMGQNPAVGGPNAGYQREAMAKLKWLVVRDLVLTESATFWQDSPEVANGQLRPEDIATEVFVLPAAAVPEKAGSFTNTQRLVQWHESAVDPPGHARSESWFMYHLGRCIKRLYRDSSDPKDRPIQALTWDYPTHGPRQEPSVPHVLREVNGFTWAPAWEERRQLSSYRDLKEDGSTACGCWIYCGVHPPEGNLAAGREKGDGYIASQWAWSWPANTRMLYNRCSADPQGRPWSERKRYIWWDAAARKWTGLGDHPDFGPNKPPDDPGDPNGRGLKRLAGDSPFVLKPWGKAWIYFPFGMKDGPLPTHYEPWETPVHNRLYPEQTHDPATKHWDVPGNAYNGVANPDYPYVLTTYRLTEHHTGGGMTRWQSWLAELQPAAFIELSPELAAEHGIEDGGWATVITARGAAEARALVTRRLRPLQVDGRIIHQIGFPWHFGYNGLARGASANDLVALVADPNVTIHEAKVLTCNLRRGRLASESGYERRV